MNGFFSRIEPMNRRRKERRSQRAGAVRVVATLIAAALCVLPPRAMGQARVESLERRGGQRIRGRLTGTASSGFSFSPTDGSAQLMLEAGSAVLFDGAGPDSPAGPPLFRVLIGELLCLSGSLRSISQTGVRLGVSWQGPEVVLPRAAVQVVRQRPGVARVLVDNFETLESSGWSKSGKVSLVEQPHASERKSLRIPSDGASVARKLDEPLSAGRFELAFHDDGAVAPGLRWSIELTFLSRTGPAIVRIVPGWADEVLAVESPSGPALPVQRLARTPGWHRLDVRFSPDSTEISVDGKDLAHGKGAEGPLVSLKIGSFAAADEAPKPVPPQTLACHVDDLQLTRFAEPPAKFELDVAQDDARLVMGDQIFGEIISADSDRVSMTVLGRPISLAWGQVSALYFRRVAAAGMPVEGLLARVEWRSGPGEEPESLDFVEGAVTAVSDSEITVATPYSGVLSIPRELVRRLLVQSSGRRYVIDATAHHLGDEISMTAPLLDPPEPEGPVLERSIELAQMPSGPWSVVLDMVQVVGEDNSEFSARVRNGELLTYVAVNGRRIDNVNRHIKTENKNNPERVRIAIPVGLLHAGKNRISLELTGTAEKQTQLDDLGVLEMALELAPTPEAKGRGAQSGRP